MNQSPETKELTKAVNTRFGKADNTNRLHTAGGRHRASHGLPHKHIHAEAAVGIREGLRQHAAVHLRRAMQICGEGKLDRLCAVAERHRRAVGLLWRETAAKRQSRCGRLRGSDVAAQPPLPVSLSGRQWLCGGAVGKRQDRRGRQFQVRGFPTRATAVS